MEDVEATVGWHEGPDYRGTTDSSHLAGRDQTGPAPYCLAGGRRYNRSGSLHVRGASGMTSIKFAIWIPVIGLALAVAATAGCERTKSATPLSPSLAGPIAGVFISVPAPVQPASGQKIKDAAQPLTLVFANADSNSVRPFALQLQVATDGGFSTVVYSQSGIPPSAEGVNKYVMPSRLQAGRTYYWRTRADDGANSSEWSEPAPFEILQPIVIGVPEPLSPISSLRVTTPTPTLRVRNGTSSGPHGALFYHFQASTSPAFAGVVGDGEVPQGGGETSVVVPKSPGPDMLVYWRARITDGENIGAWSRTEVYRTPLASTAPAPPPGGGGSGANCASNNGPAIAACVEAAYPSYRAAGVSHNQREANMIFLRDRMIEAGICGGLDLAWNRKRGTGPHSIDALAWRTSSGDEVVDIGLAYDDTSRELRLQWGIVAGPPGYDPYSPRPTCQ